MREAITSRARWGIIQSLHELAAELFRGYDAEEAAGWRAPAAARRR
jgi:hypothetical protein